MHITARGADDGEVAARADGDAQHRVFPGVGDAVSPDARGRREDVFAQHAVGEPPRVRAGFALVTRHDVGPIAFARLAPRHAGDRGEFQLLFREFQALGAALDVRLRQLAALLILDRREDAKRAVVPGG